MKYKTEEKVLRVLHRKKDVRIEDRVILVNMGTTKKGERQKQNDLGLKSWGNIDYLMCAHGYSQIFVGQF